MHKIVIYTKDSCPYCRMAKDLLTARKLTFEEIRVDLDPAKLQEMIERSKRRTVPQIFIDDKAVGGYEDLAALVQSGKLDQTKI